MGTREAVPAVSIQRERRLIGWAGVPPGAEATGTELERRGLLCNNLHFHDGSKDGNKSNQH
jgi:hypothetical protein